jgi:peptide subunit release factor RF-3
MIQNWKQRPRRESIKPIELTEEVKQKIKKRDEAISALFPAPDQDRIREIVKAGMNEMIEYSQTQKSTRSAYTSGETG